EPEPEGHVVEDAHLERIGLLEHHADVAAQDHRIDVARIHVLPVEVHVPLEAKPVDEVVHAVKASQHRALAAARGSDEAGDLALLDGHVAVPHGEELAVEDLLELTIDDDLFLSCHRPVARRIVEISDASIPDESLDTQSTVRLKTISCRTCYAAMWEIAALEPRRLAADFDKPLKYMDSEW